MEPLYSFVNLKKYAHNPCVIWKESTIRERIYNYQEIIEAAEKLFSVFDEINVKKQSRILVNIGHSAPLLSVILSILNASCCYCPVSLKEEQIQECFDLYQVCYIISDARISTRHQSERKIDVLGTECYIYKYDFVEKIYDINPDILCYSIKTSGSTGQPQIVNVPRSCILPNIIALSRKFSIKCNDVIFVSSPPTFDPFIVDVFMALMNGAALILVPLAVRLIPDMLAALFFRSDKYNATVCQMTPSLFRRFDQRLLKEYIFHKNSSLRLLVLGGESFPCRTEFQDWPNWQCAKHIKVYNIYGITEVSCWSSIAEITLDDPDMSLGQSLDHETNLVVRSLERPYNKIIEGTGELCIESTQRKCFLASEDPMIVLSDTLLERRTGDFVEIKDKKIYYKSRTDAIVKRIGCKINLKASEEKILIKFPCVRDVCCVFDLKNSILIAFLIAQREEVKPSLHQLCRHFDKTEAPDDCVYLDKFPLSCHGKTSKSKLLNYYWSIHMNKKGNKRDSVRDVFVEKLKHYLGDCNAADTLGKSEEPSEKCRRKQSWDELSFIDAGGTSFIALRLISELEEITYQSFSHLFIQLLDQTQTIKEILQELEETTKYHENIVSSAMLTTCEDNFQLNIVWKYNLEKCIDASPTVIETYDKGIVAVGSHSHKLACLDIHNGTEISKLELPDRIESQVRVEGAHGIVGCYDGVLYKFILETGEVVQKFDSNGMIKYRPLLIDGMIFFGNYSKADNIFCVDYKTFRKVWSIKVGCQSCFATPIVLNAIVIIVCTLDGTVACIHNETGNVVWKIKLNSPIFSTPTRLSDTAFCVAEVTGKLHYIEHGVELSSYDLNGEVFASLLAIDSKTIICGCYDHKIYCFEYEDSSKELTLKWNIQLDASIYSTISLVQLEGDSYLVACTTKGKVNLINMKKTCLEKSIQLDGEIFSSPAVWNNRILVGCRDNYLYCIEVTKNEENESV